MTSSSTTLDDLTAADDTSDRNDTQNDDQPRSLSDVVGHLREGLDDDDTSVQHIMDTFAGRLFGPVVVLPALFALTPLGAIPLVPTIIGSLLVLFGLQRVFGRDHPWIPRFLRDKTVDADKLRKGLDRFEPWAKRIDKVIKPRASFLVEGAMERVLAVAVVLLGLAMPPLELVPFAVFIPAGGALLIGVALLARDGVVAGLGFVLTITTIGLGLMAL